MIPLFFSRNARDASSTIALSCRIRGAVDRLRTVELRIGPAWYALLAAIDWTREGNAEWPAGVSLATFVQSDVSKELIVT